MEEQISNSELIETKVLLDNEKVNRSYDLRIKTVEDMEILIAQMKKNKNFKYRNKSEFVDIAANQLINNLWVEAFNEERNT